MDKLLRELEYKQCTKCGEYHSIPKNKEVCIKCATSKKPVVGLLEGEFKI
jgi:formylmethanofuran dehydrogenase subunit E